MPVYVGKCCRPSKLHLAASNAYSTRPPSLREALPPWMPKHTQNARFRAVGNMSMFFAPDSELPFLGFLRDWAGGFCRFRMAVSVQTEI